MAYELLLQSRELNKREGSNLASKIPNEQGGFEKYFANCNTVNKCHPIYSLKTNKRPGYDDISFNAINNVFDFIVEPKVYI